MTRIRSVLITGCSSGIGLACAHDLKSRGYQVFASARKQEDVEHLRAQGFDAYLLDVDNPEHITAVVEAIQSKHSIDAVFHNAGYGQPGAVEDLSREAIRQQFETNVFGALELSNALLPAMRAQGYGRLVFNSSMLGIVSMPYRGAYNASKFALEGLCDTLRLELRDTNIKVSLIEPGPIESKFRENALKQFQAHIKPEESAHKKKYQAMFNRLEAEHNPTPFTLPATAVAQKLRHALESPHPKAHYPVTLPAHAAFLFRRLLPTRLLDRIANRAGR